MVAKPAPSFSLAPYSYAEARALVEELGLAEPIAVTLVRRGYRTVEEARRFLEADELHDPMEFESMAEIAETIRDAVAKERRITVHGDYDCDGVCSTAILVRSLRAIGATCDWYIPDRMGDGYGLTVAGVEVLAERGTELLITTDCGIGCAEEVSAAREHGIEVIVTDHHTPGDCLPDCRILHPAVSGYPCAELCATGVAYKLATALLGAERTDEELDLVALATVADLVPLRGENRSLVRAGLAVARRARRPGLRALCAAAGVTPERLDEGDLAFRLGPRVNAAGRMYRADAGVELMLTEDEARAAAIAAELDAANRERRRAEDAVLQGAEKARGELPEDLAAAPGLVLAGEGWHPGVVGIVASRLAERHGVPAVLIGLDGAGGGRGSGRGIPGFDLLGALDACSEHLRRYGGHRAAAGLELSAERLDAFRRDFAAHCAEVLGEGGAMEAEPIDAIVGGESLGHEVAAQLESLGPFGMGNPGVRLLVPAAHLSDVRPMGETERHARFRIQSGARSAQGVAFGVNGKLSAAERAEVLDVSVSLELNEWNGAVTPRVVLGKLYEAQLGPAREEPTWPDDEEWRRRLDAEREADPRSWPRFRALEGTGRRAVVDRRGASGVATVAALASSGERVLVLCADALRRRQLVERAALPARFGGGRVAVASGRLADAALSAAVSEVAGEGCGVLLADWAALTREPALPLAFEHVVVIDPPPFPAFGEAAAAPGPGRGPGFLHEAWGEAEVELALRVHEDEWPSRPSLALLYRALREVAGEGVTRGPEGLGEAEVRRLLQGDGRYPASPEVGARRLRVLEELGAVAWAPSGAQRVLRVVSSEAKDLERIPAFAAYRESCEEGRRSLSRRRQPS